MLRGPCRVDEDPVEKQIRLANESRESQVRALPSEGCTKPQFDQLEELFKENTIPYISHDKVNQPDVIRCKDSSMVLLHLEGLGFRV